VEKKEQKEQLKAAAKWLMGLTNKLDWGVNGGLKGQRLGG
jgi:hypothetical protein